MNTKHILTSLLILASTPFATVAEVITEAQFNAMFPNRSYSSCAADNANTVFTYANLVSAGDMFPNFANVGTLEDKKRDLAAFLGQAAHETTGANQDANWGFCFTEEIICKGIICNQYTKASTEYPAQAGKSYHGRGAIQLTSNPNYGIASQAILGDKMTLLKNPELVKTGDMAFKTSLFYWMDGTSTRPSPHRIITGQATGDSRGNTYGGVTNSINGGLECGAGNSGNISKQHDRVNYFKNFATDLGISAKPSSFSGTDDAYFYCTAQSNFADSPWLNQDSEPLIILDGASSSNQISSSSISSSSAVSSSSQNASSSSVVDGTCSRTLVNNYKFNLTNGSVALAGYQENNYDSQGGVFSSGDVIIPEGQDCDLALTLDGPSDTWNLYTTSNWTGSNLTDVALEKVTYIANSSSQVSSSSVALSSSEALSSSTPLSSSLAISSSEVLSSSTPLSSSLAISSSEAPSSSTPLSSSLAISSSEALSSSIALSSSLELSSSEALSSSIALSSSLELSSSEALSSSTPLSSSTLTDPCEGIPAWEAKTYVWTGSKEYVTYNGKLYSHYNWASSDNPEINSAWTLEDTCFNNISSELLQSSIALSSSVELSSSEEISSSISLSSSLALSSSETLSSSIALSSSEQLLSSIALSSSQDIWTSSSEELSSEAQSSQELSSSEDIVTINENIKTSLKLQGDQLRITSHWVGKSNIRLIDMNGRVLLSTSIILNGGTNTHSLSGELQTGSYFVSVRWPNASVTTERVVIP